MDAMTVDIAAAPAEAPAPSAPSVAATKGSIRKPSFYDQVKGRVDAPQGSNPGLAKPKP